MSGRKFVLKVGWICSTRSPNCLLKKIISAWREYLGVNNQMEVQVGFEFKMSAFSFEINHKHWLFNWTKESAEGLCRPQLRVMRTVALDFPAPEISLQLLVPWLLTWPFLLTRLVKDCCQESVRNVFVICVKMINNCGEISTEIISKWKIVEREFFSRVMLSSLFCLSYPGDCWSGLLSGFWGRGGDDFHWQYKIHSSVDLSMDLYSCKCGVLFVKILYPISGIAHLNFNTILNLIIWCKCVKNSSPYLS